MAIRIKPATVPAKPADRRGLLAIDSFEDVKPEPVRPAPKPKRGRPNLSGVDSKEYNRLYMIDKRKADKLGISVAEFRGKK